MNLTARFLHGACFVAAIVLILGLLMPNTAFAQEEEPDYPVDPALMAGMKWRNVGPYRGGRAVAVAGVAGDVLT